MDQSIINGMIDFKNSNRITPAEDQSNDELPIKLDSPEDVLIEVVGPHDDDPANLKWDNWSIESCTVIGGEENVMGAASYEQSYGSFLDYTIQGLIDCPGAGWFLVKDITATFHKGDGWMTDDDMDFACREVRPATPDEIAQA